MKVTETKTPSGVVIEPAQKREYNVSGRSFQYTAPSCEIVTFEDCILTSGSWEYGLAGIVKDKKFYHERFTKDANNWQRRVYVRLIGISNLPDGTWFGIYE